MRLGIDDTDSPSGGCTTWVLSEVVRRLAEAGEEIDLLGFPRLVRLNPNVPFKTRGNAALAARFGHGRGASRVIGGSGGASWRSFARGLELSSREIDRLWEIALEVVRSGSRWGEEGTDPTVVLSPRPLPSDLYWRAVQEVVEPGEALEPLLAAPGSRLAAYGSGQGIVGAAAAIAWPARRRTYEAIAYRARPRWGTSRKVSAESVRRMVERYPETFLSYDERTRRTLIAPHTPCPILCGVRARWPDRLPRALEEIDKGEPTERWMLFETNQATGDHLVARRAEEATPGTSGIFEGVAVGAPEEMRGGHVRIRLEDGSGTLPCVAFEPTKTLAPVARALLPGDRVQVWGSLAWPSSSAPRPSLALRLEGIRVLRARPAWKKTANPRCPQCGSRTSSLGRGKGFRCPSCRVRLPPERAEGERQPRGGLRGSYLPTPSARRHLAPLVAPRSGSPSLYRRRS
jgi:tRNA(Ile2)-agmatinylcytidine synthase